MVGWSATKPAPPPGLPGEVGEWTPCRTKNKTCQRAVRPHVWQNRPSTANKFRGICWVLQKGFVESPDRERSCSSYLHDGHPLQLKRSLVVSLCLPPDKGFRSRVSVVGRAQPYTTLINTLRRNWFSSCMNVTQQEHGRNEIDVD